MQLPGNDFALAWRCVSRRWQDGAETEHQHCFSSFRITMLGFPPLSNLSQDCNNLANTSKVISCLPHPSGQSCVCVSKLWSFDTPGQTYRM